MKKAILITLIATYNIAYPQQKITNPASQKLHTFWQHIQSNSSKNSQKSPFYPEGLSLYPEDRIKKFIHASKIYQYLKKIMPSNEFFRQPSKSTPKD